MLQLSLIPVLDETEVIELLADPVSSLLTGVVRVSFELKGANGGSLGLLLSFAQMNVIWPLEFSDFS